MNGDIASIVHEFQVDGKCLETQPFGNGHLHDTYKVLVQTTNTDAKTCVSFILQRINRFAFRNPPQLMENISRITRHIHGKLLQTNFPPHDISRRVLTLIPTHQGSSYHVDDRGQYWRMFTFITGTRSYDIIHDPHLLFQAAFMFGDFLRLLEDLPDPVLFDTIPDFHNGNKRMQAFQEALRADSCNRAISVRPEIEFVQQHAALWDVIPRLLSQHLIPLRPTHNDTKVNNVLLDETTGEGMCVIDLDTTMPGVFLYDFGDLARTTLSTRDEDEQDLSTVYVEIPRFKTILEGFLMGAGDSLSTAEKHYLFFSTQFMPMIIGLRFLTDYLLGDVYFKVHREGQNLHRCKRQFKLAQSIMEKEDEMRKIVEFTTMNGTVPPASVLP